MTGSKITRTFGRATAMFLIAPEMHIKAGVKALQNNVYNALENVAFFTPKENVRKT
jgi:hypothetical protein